MIGVMTGMMTGIVTRKRKFDEGTSFKEAKDLKQLDEDIVKGDDKSIEHYYNNLGSLSQPS